MRKSHRQRRLTLSVELLENRRLLANGTVLISIETDAATGASSVFGSGTTFATLDKTDQDAVLNADVSAAATFTSISSTLASGYSQYLPQSLKNVISGAVPALGVANASLSAAALGTANQVFQDDLQKPDVTNSHLVSDGLGVFSAAFGTVGAVALTFGPVGVAAAVPVNLLSAGLTSLSVIADHWNTLGTDASALATIAKANLTSLGDAETNLILSGTSMSDAALTTTSEMFSNALTDFMTALEVEQIPSQFISDITKTEADVSSAQATVPGLFLSSGVTPVNLTISQIDDAITLTSTASTFPTITGNEVISPDGNSVALAVSGINGNPQISESTVLGTTTVTDATQGLNSNGSISFLESTTAQNTGQVATVISGQGDVSAVCNTPVSLADGTQASVIGSANTINLGQSSTVSVNGASNDVNVTGSGNTCSITGASVNATIGGSGNNIITTGAFDNSSLVGTNITDWVNGASEIVTATGAADGCNVGGTGGSINLNGPGDGASVTGAGNTCYTSGASINTTISGSGNNVVLTGPFDSSYLLGSNIIAWLNGASEIVTATGAADGCNVGGTGGSINLNGPGDGASVTGAGNVCYESAEHQHHDQRLRQQRSPHRFVRFQLPGWHRYHGLGEWRQRNRDSHRRSRWLQRGWDRRQY